MASSKKSQSFNTGSSSVLPVELRMCLSLLVVPYLLWASLPLFFLPLFIDHGLSMNVWALILFGGPLVSFLSNFFVIIELKKQKRSAFQFFVTVGIIHLILFFLLYCLSTFTSIFSPILITISLLPLLLQALVTILVFSKRSLFFGKVSGSKSLGIIFLAILFVVLEITLAVASAAVALSLLLPPLSI